MKFLTGQKFVAQKEYGKALKIFLNLKASDPSNDEISFYLGLIYFELNNFDKSSFYYNKFLEKNPNSITALYNIAFLKQSMGKIEVAKNIYNNLIKQDITDYLLNESLNFDYYISTDVFVYIGDLSDVFRLIKSRNKTGGKLAFSTEDYDGDGFFLEKSGRYSHSKKYIEDLCEEFGYQLRYFESLPLRKDKNQYISGGLYLLDF